MRVKGTTRAKFSNSNNLWKPHDNNVCIGYKELAMQFSHCNNGSLALTYLTN